ncbi:heat-inducible transcriptional repressor HrcA [Spirulina subsalsa FACHB-351]|uniref:Heat-inducible transcription repressor HrcA n=1 Tax=Spirulina subsalsa FACHB-351 TaxID=234711 RepID=A0ABT3L4C5_9CYAN|nr:heat-inducible transcriptional repressor HrcA [Spirulina subsalsa]MCW6036353.1 heat-inducible transcriptional repressor HrcA [Spirulina subsalsa FACHB-351]
MSPQLKLSDRHQHILWATIRHYIATAEPVGSRTIAQEYGLQVSSATIRNAMGRLEKAGLLYQPHTSAGRIPSDSGYRIYVDNLMSLDESWNNHLLNLYHQKLNWEAYNIETLLKRAAQILASLSGHIALITLPQNSQNQLRHLQLIPVNEKQVMLLVVTDGYYTQSLLIDLPQRDYNSDNREDLESELELLSNFLNSKLKGKSLATLNHLNWGELDQEFKKYTEFMQDILKVLARENQSTDCTPIVIRGISEALRQPEFSEVQQVQMLLHLLEEEQEQLFPLIFEYPDLDEKSPRVSVRIGSENPLEPLTICTVISANYKQGDIPVGSIGLIGPTRMLYENAITLVEAAAYSLSEALS